MRRKRCDFCRGFIEINDIAHKCSERRLISIERETIRQYEQEQQNLIDPERTYDDRLLEAEIVMSEYN